MISRPGTALAWGLISRLCRPDMDLGVQAPRRCRCGLWVTSQELPEVVALDAAVVDPPLLRRPVFD